MIRLYNRSLCFFCSLLFTSDGAMKQLFLRDFFYILDKALDYKAQDPKKSTNIMISWFGRSQIESLSQVGVIFSVPSDICS